jgi:hypothetical protein
MWPHSNGLANMAKVITLILFNTNSAAFLPISQK